MKDNFDENQYKWYKKQIMQTEFIALFASCH